MTAASAADRSGTALEADDDPIVRALDELTHDVRAGAALTCGVSDPVNRLLARHEITTEAVGSGELIRLQLSRQFTVAIVDHSAVVASTDATQRAQAHAIAQHLVPGGRLVTIGARTTDRWAIACRSCDLTELQVASTLLAHRRSDRFNVHDLVFEARRTIRRLTPHELHARLRNGSAPLVVDTRTEIDRERFGVIPGSIHVPRTVLEWHLDPANGYLHPRADGFDQPIVVVCNGGYSSSLAAASLIRLGFTNVADLIGGVGGWAASGLPLTAPDHAHLDFPSLDFL